MKIQKYLSQIGFCSRRKAEKHILNKKIRVNMKSIKIGHVLNENKDKVYFEKKEIKINKKKQYILLNKPRGYISSTKDPNGRKTVLELLKNIKERIYPVGRLDYRTEGLLILTNDGNLANKLTHPKYNIKKTYKIKCFGNIIKNDLILLQKGIIIDEKYKAKLYDIELLESNKKFSLLKASLYEGRNREIRKIFEKIKHPIIKLTRIQIGFIFLKNLKKGTYRFLNNIEIKHLKNITNKKI